MSHFLLYSKTNVTGRSDEDLKMIKINPPKKTYLHLKRFLPKPASGRLETFWSLFPLRSFPINMEQFDDARNDEETAAALDPSR